MMCSRDDYEVTDSIFCQFEVYRCILACKQQIDTFYAFELVHHRVHILVPVNRCPGMSCNLVDNKISLDKISHHMSSRPRSSGSKKLETVAKFLTYPFQEFLGHFDGFPLGLNVLLVDNVLVRIHEDGLGSSGADVNPQENLKLSTG